MPAILLGLIISIACLYFFPDYPVKEPFTQYWWSVFVVLAVSKTLFTSAATGMVRSIRVHKEVSSTGDLPPQIKLQLKGALVYTLLSLPLMLTSLKLWVWMPVALDALAVLLSTIIFGIARKRAADEPLAFDMPADKAVRYKDFVILSRFACYMWQPAAILALVACWGAWSM